MKPKIVNSLISQYINNKNTAAGLPIIGTFELTPLCNFNCRMCYVHLTGEEMKARGNLMTADEIIDTAKQARDGGMLYMLLTGGEPMMRPDFCEILERITALGLVVSLNTNASVMSDEIFAAIKKCPPSRINVSLYGSSPETYRNLCRTDAFETVVENIKKLVTVGINVKANLMLNQYTKHELEALLELTQKLNVQMQMCTYQYPPMRRDEAMVGQNDRLSPEDAAKYSMYFDKLRFDSGEFEKRMERMSECLIESDAIPENVDSKKDAGTKSYGCRAGRTSFWVTWDGRLTPCGMLNQPQETIRGRDFNECWNSIKEQCAGITVPQKCVGCKYSEYCPVCPASCYCESGTLDGVPEYVCRMTHETMRLVGTESKN